MRQNTRNRYKRIVDRQHKVEGYLRARNTEEYDTPDDGLDHEAWLLAEREALQLELDELEKVLLADGSIDY